MWWAAASAVLLVGLMLRLRGLHDPILDHPGWRQGDTAAIARNFATLDFNPFHPQTDYDGPPPNYVELELQIVPWLAALGYKIFGIHETFGRLISIGFSLGTVAALVAFGRRLFGAAAGLAAAFAFAVFPGSLYYGRTFTPDTTMTFFLTAAVYAAVRWMMDDDARFGRRFGAAASLAALAILAKPVAAVGLLPIACALVARNGLRAAARAPATYAFFACALAPYALYDAYVKSIAEWHWASGIMALHVLPSLRGALSSPAALHAKLLRFRDALGMLQQTMLGVAATPLCVFGFVAAVSRGSTPLTRALFGGWLAAALAYAFVVVTVERVDYYLYPFLPLGALCVGALTRTALAAFSAGLRRRAALAACVCAALVMVVSGPRAVAPYYAYGKAVYRQAAALNAVLPARALVVMGHYDPSVLYYIGRKGWQEDPYLWTPFDEQSAIRKGARYFIAVEPNRLARNVELYAWLQRFPRIRTGQSAWPVYETDYAKIVPGAEARWRAFRRAEKAGRATMPSR